MRRFVPLLVASIALASASPVLAQPCTADDPATSRYCGVPLVTGLGGPNDYGNSCLVPNDDGSSSLIDITPAFPMGLNFFGTTHRSMYVNTNGNITFSAPLGTYTPAAFPVAARPMIAPYWADVDIRGDGVGTGCDRPYWSGSSCGLASGVPNGVYWWMELGRIVVTWDRTGVYSCQDDRKMTFQLIITGSSCGATTDFDVEFRYAQCEWTTGSASGGTLGFSTEHTPRTPCTTAAECPAGTYHCEDGVCWRGVPGQAGFDAGDTTNYVEIAGSRTNEIHQILCEDSNVGVPGVYRFQVRSGSVVCPDAGDPCVVPGMLGACAAARTQCFGGGVVCRSEVMPTDESCDAIDNDCDGSTDEGDALCAGATEICDRGTCIERCFEGGCDVGFDCVEGHCVESACAGVTCPEGQRCEGGACVEACAGVVCPVGLSCRSGRCVDLCASIECDECSICDQGDCVTRCTPASCPAGDVCLDGLCQEEACVGVTCEAGFRCLGGECVDACIGVVCPRGAMCEAGACVPRREELPDAGPRPDAGPPVEVDAGSDAGDVGWDAGIDGGRCGPGCETPRSRGCGCSVPGAERGTGALAALLAGLALAIVAGRRRR